MPRHEVASAHDARVRARSTETAGCAELTAVDHPEAAKREGESASTTGRPQSYFDIKNERLRQAKLAVANFIVRSYFNEGDSILLDAGSSLWPVAQVIVQRAQQRPYETHYTIMTHNYEAFQILVKGPIRANLNIILAGGRYDQDLNALFGVQTASNYEIFYPRVVVIGVSGFVSDVGLFCHGNTEELQVKELIFKKTCTRRIIVADHTKLGLPDSFTFGRSVDLKAGAGECVVVTSKPGSGDSKVVRDRYRTEIEKLRKKYQITVEEIDVPEDETVARAQPGEPVHGSATQSERVLA
jgi:DeoR/GlpR family transcriptional regulator of sugar metabolism